MEVPSSFPKRPHLPIGEVFHSQEMIRVALDAGMTATPIELFPRLGSDKAGCSPFIVYLDRDGEANWEYFEKFIVCGKGVMEGSTNHGRQPCGRFPKAISSMTRTAKNIPIRERFSKNVVFILTGFGASDMFDITTRSKSEKNNYFQYRAEPVAY